MPGVSRRRSSGSLSAARPADPPSRLALPIRQTVERRAAPPSSPPIRRAIEPADTLKKANMRMRLYNTSKRHDLLAFKATRTRAYNIDDVLA